MSNIRIALTGHRPERLNFSSDVENKDWYKINLWLQDMLYSYSKSNDQLDIYCGMASGSDILFGALAISHKILFDNKYNIKARCILPCKDYNSSDKQYDFIKEYADEWIELSDKFYKGCDNIRDQYMVDHCDILLAIWDRNKSGGVWSTIRKAQKTGKEIIYCPEEILQIKKYSILKI